MIGGHTDLCKEVLPSFNKIIEFPDMEVDSGLRHLLDHFTLPGESQQVDRIIDSFSHIFYRDNQKSVFAEAGAIYSLSFLLMMLQTNLHNPQVHEKMKLADVTKLAKGMNKGADFPQEYLISLYNSVQKSQLGFHEKQKEIDFVEAYKQGGKKLS
jgi:brefeldin A-inhibited guanine nucleotide-exchange protein